ncbi:methylaspartate mutase [Nocardiopsis algeriensis]|uniref:Methylaspartate mutase epsilon subunit n=1 Tax=Nocardiopsis algeriensis TaxID=1478215 RepID=A0A841II43_9ACTN|nr:methylaspartate mutase [Nocardiopsis algeriensis]MBB6118427.1 methylaspartate mutase epsilon subunit [Nocardiopsis algeriensis]
MTRDDLPDTDAFGSFVAREHARGRLVVQPRMGFGDPRRMRAGLAATRAADAASVGTITLDSYTRVGDNASARRAVLAGTDLNGYPIVARPPEQTREVLAGLAGPDFPVQVRHGSAAPQEIFRSLLRAGLTATEGGPVSYCLPYGRTPLERSVANWREGAAILAAHAEDGRSAHVETFGGCMLGQLCPPGMLVALSLLEGMFFLQHGIRGISLSYAQQTSPAQDREAIRALRRLASEFLGGARWHVVLYTYMGLFPRTPGGARSLLRQAARTAVEAGAERVIVKTEAEAHRIPTIGENVRALEIAARAAEETRPAAGGDPDSDVYLEARALLSAVLEHSDDIGTGLLRAFSRGHLDIPYCLHPDNAGRVRSRIGDDGHLRWADTGSLPLPPVAHRSGAVTSADLISTLSYMERRHDSGAAPVPERNG